MSHFDDSELVVKGMEDPGTTGNFEVVNMATMEVLYSKKVTNAKCVDEGEKGTKVHAVFGYVSSGHISSNRAISFRTPTHPPQERGKLSRRRSRRLLRDRFIEEPGSNHAGDVNEGFGVPTH
jgi:hypothetical protein